MRDKLLRCGLLAAAAGFLVIEITGCAVAVRGPGVRIRPAAAVVVYGPPVEYGYQPLLYQGHVVYYTSAGLPFYWNAGVRVYVPVAHRAHYTDHWRKHRKAYHTWHDRRGQHYRHRVYERKHKHKDRREKKHRHRDRH
ncbi:MAG: hypothetical protein JXR96_30705 [Deltaproteobacteria bacterium]|nr:hypothetical protein [Deltaproteobacteria bacterium]